MFACAAALRTNEGAIGSHTITTPAEQAQAIADARATLGQETFVVLWAEGQTMSLEQAIHFALSTPDKIEARHLAEGEKAAAPQPLTHPAGLTAREIEVLRLLVQGLPYTEVADKLVISRRTVNAHVTSIFSKLGVTSRAAATRFALDHHLA